MDLRRWVNRPGHTQPINNALIIKPYVLRDECHLSVNNPCPLCINER